MSFIVIFVLSIAFHCIDCVVFNIHACTIDFCKTYKETIGCERLSTPCAAQNQTHNGVIFRSATPCSCCETCLANLNEGDDCSTGLPGAPSPNSICGNGLYCTIKQGNQHPTCEQMFATSECFRMKRKFDDDLRDGLIGHLQARPSCDGDGNFSPIVCNPGQNCFCVNEKGERIFGDAPHRQNIEHIMHCGCSRLNDKLKDLVEQRFPFFTTRCKSDGSFDPLQCFGNLCLCVDSVTGSPTSDIKNLTMSLNSDEATATLVGLRDLPCYDEKIHLYEFNYARPCENIKRGLINTILEAKRDGINDAETHVDICDPDGSFKPVQYNDLSAFCVDHEGNRIEEFVVLKNSTESKYMNCKCARARNLLMKNNYLEIPECCTNGNYKSVACRRGFCHCVNEDGKQVSIEVIDIHKDKLPCNNVENEFNEVPIITHIADQPVSIKDIDFPAITICEGFMHGIEHYLDEIRYPERLTSNDRYFKNSKEEFHDELKYFYYLNYIQMLEEIENGVFKKVDKLGSKILKRFQVVDILSNRGILTKVNLSAPTDDFLEILHEFRSDFSVDFLWNELKGTKFSTILTEFGLCRTFNIAMPDHMFYTDSISDDFDHKYYSVIFQSDNYDYTQTIPRKANNIDDTVFLELANAIETESFKHVGQLLMFHDPYELPSRHSKTIIINVQENSVVNLRLIPEMFDIDESLYDDHPIDRNCYFDDEFKLKLFKVYTKTNCESESLTNYMIEKCGCVEFFMIRNFTTRICSASEKKCYDEVKSSFESQKSQYKCLQSCSYVRFGIEQLHGSDQWKEKFALKFMIAPKSFFIKYNEISFQKIIRKQNFDFLTFLSFVGGFLGLFAGLSMLSAVELFYWFCVRIFTRKCNQRTAVVQPIDEEIKEKSNIFKDFFNNS